MPMNATRFLGFLAMIFLSIVLNSQVADARRVALVIGNANYEHQRKLSRLKNPANDARAMARLLSEDIDLEVITARQGASKAGIDLERREMINRIQRFEDRARGGEIALVVYSGHGIQVGGENYLIPVDASGLEFEHRQESPTLEIGNFVETASERGLGVEPVPDILEESPDTEQGNAGDPCNRRTQKGLTATPVTDCGEEASDHGPEGSAAGGDFDPENYPEETECDRLAANPDDPMKVGVGVGGGRLEAAHAITACSRAVEAHPDTLRFRYQLGRAYWKGLHPEEAKKHFLVAAEGGHTQAMNDLGALIGQQEHLRGEDYSEALKWFQKAAENGHAHAKANLGVFYEHGIIVEKDKDMARYLFQSSAKEGNSYGMYKLAMMYRQVCGVKICDEFRHWIEKGAESGSQAAQNEMTKIHAFEECVKGEGPKVRILDDMEIELKPECEYGG